MKELSLIEKADAYDRVSKEVRDFFEGKTKMPFDVDKTLEFLFPELKESEDEKIRKELLEHCKNQAEPYIRTGNKCPQIQSWIDWLEKQGKPKFAWSEEDEKLYKLSLENLTELKDRFGEEHCGVGNCIDWFKSLKDRIGYEVNCTIAKEFPPMTSDNVAKPNFKV